MDNICKCDRYPGEFIYVKDNIRVCTRCRKSVLSMEFECPVTSAKFWSKFDRIYLASPYTHDDGIIRDTRYELALYASSVLANAGAVVYSPIVYTHVMATLYNIQPTNSAWWVSFDESFIVNWATTIAVLKLPGWDISKGVAKELDIAKEHKLKETYLTLERLYDISRTGSTRLA